MQDHRTAGRAAADVPRQTEAESKRAESRDRGQRFARALTRSVFGRHYWDDRLEAEMRRQLQISKERFKT